MKKTVIIIVIICCLLGSCASIIANTLGMKQEDSAYRIVTKNPGENRAVAAFYGYDYLKAKEDKRAETAMREPKYNTIPEFGYIQIRIQAWTPDTANPKDWLFIVQDKNKNEIYRSYGISSYPRRTVNDISDTNTIVTWWNLHNIYLKEQVEFPLYLRVVTAFNENAIDITIIEK
jgi:hypothetical protein